MQTPPKVRLHRTGLRLVSCLVLLLLRLCCGTIHAQNLGQLQYEELPSAGLIVDDPAAAVLVVETTVQPLSFLSRGGIRKVAEPESGVYRVFLSPGVHRMEIRAEGYLLLRLPRWNFAPKSGRRIRVMARQIPEGEGTLVLESRPPGASIVLNGVEIVEQTPLTLLNQRTGGYRITLSGVDGYGSADTSAVVRKGATTRLSVSLPRQVAGLRVDSDPSGALVVLDGDTLGLTPLTRPDLPPGDGTLAILLEGYEPTVQPVRLRTGRTATINAYLVSVVGRLSVTTTPRGATVYVARRPLGVCRDTALVRGKLPPGAYAVRAVLEGYHPAADTATVIGGRTTQVELMLREWKGALYVLSSPVAGEIYLDDHALNKQTPSRLENLSPGMHRVAVRAAGFTAGKDTATVRSGRTQTVRVVLLEQKRTTPPPVWAEDVVDSSPVRRIRTPARTEHQLMHVPAGEFMMGTSMGEVDQLLSDNPGWQRNLFEDEQPQHRVYLNGYYMDEHEVTNGQWNGYARSAGKTAKSGPADHPAVYVSWDDARTYCEWAGLRLPTEAEWEKAARGGMEGRAYPWGETASHDQANYKGTGGRDRWAGTSPVSSFPANGYGLHDMAGNVWEWVLDWYDRGYYEGSPSRNPTGPLSGSSRVLRGGSWYFSPRDLRSARRSGIDPSYPNVNSGFRCAQDE